MRRLNLGIFLFFIFTASFGQMADTLLYKAYKTKSATDLQAFFEHWAAENPPLTAEDCRQLDDTTKNIYQVFSIFYNPMDIKRTGGSEWGNVIYKDVKYLLVQDKIRFAIIDTLSYGTTKRGEMIFSVASKYDTLEDFRPQLQLPNVKCLPLTNKYDELLNRYLGDKHYKLGKGSIMSPARSKGESEKRMKFLSSFIKVWYGHWGGYWQLHSYPFASRMLFDKSFTNAVVYFRMVYEGGYAYFRKINGEWSLVEAKLTWIE